MDNKVALSLITLVEILFWVDLKHEVAHLEAYWFDLLGDIFTWLLDIAESLI
jgi:hypothetical protein